MDGNDLNPTIKNGGPAMSGPAPRMRPELANAANVAAVQQAMGATEQMPAVAAVPGQVTVSQQSIDAAIASEEEAAAAREKNAKIQKIVALVLTAVCAGLAILALAIVVLTNIPRIAELENRIDAVELHNQTLQDQIIALNKRIGYDIDVVFFDELAPGTTYEVSLQPDSREVIVTALAGCSLTNYAECEVEPEVLSTILSVYEYNLVADVYSGIDGSSVDYTKNMIDWTVAIKALIDGDDVIADKNSTNWEMLKVYDADGDGSVTRREQGAYLLTQMLKS